MTEDWEDVHPDDMRRRDWEADVYAQADADLRCGYCNRPAQPVRRPGNMPVCDECDANDRAVMLGMDP